MIARVLAALAFLTLASATASSVLADGLLPPHPYNYLHPPPAFASNNNPPLSGIRTLPVDFMQANRWIAFTEDGQAGITGPAAAFTVHAPVTAVLVRVQPVNVPPGLPNGLAADGNAYSITAAVQPRSSPARLARSVTLTLQWPHLPLAIYVYSNGGWSQLCSFNQSTRSPSTISCPTSSLGTFLAVVPAPKTASSGSSGIVSRITSLGLPVLALIALAIVLLVVALILFIAGIRGRAGGQPPA